MLKIKQSKLELEIISQRSIYCHNKSFSNRVVFTRHPFHKFLSIRLSKRLDSGRESDRERCKHVGSFNIF